MPLLRLTAAVVAALSYLLAPDPVESAGFRSDVITDVEGRAIPLGIWYPAEAEGSLQRLGNFRQSVAHNAAITGQSLPLVLISHGSGGALSDHYDTAMELAEAGFVVVALTHPGDNHEDRSGSLLVLDRPRQVTRVLDYILGEWPGRHHVDGRRVGIFGFAAGGFAALVAVGARPDLSRFARYCGMRPKDFTCKVVAREARGQELSSASGVLHDRRITAAVIAAPAFGFAFGQAELQEVSVPIQLWQAERDEIMPHPWYSEVIRRALPRRPNFQVAAGAGHYDFVAPCGDVQARHDLSFCRSSPAFNREAFHHRFNRAIVEFFAKALADEGRQRP